MSSTSGVFASGRNHKDRINSYKYGVNHFFIVHSFHDEMISSQQILQKKVKVIKDFVKTKFL